MVIRSRLLIRTCFVSDLIHPEHLGIIRLRYENEDKDCDGLYFLYSFKLMTCAAASVHRVILYNKGSISQFDREGPIYNKLLISLINRVHSDRNKLFHVLSRDKAHSYICLNRTWYHYWEFEFHRRNERDTLYATIYDYFEPGDLEITECDLYRRDRSYLKPFNYYLTPDSIQHIDVDWGVIEYDSDGPIVM